MGSSPGPAAAAVADRESSQLVGLGFPEPTVEPAEDRAVAGRDDAHHGPTAGALAAQPAGRLGSPRLALGCEDARWQDCALRRAARATSSGAASPAGPLPAATLARRPSGEREAAGSRPVRRSRHGTPFAGAGPTCCSCWAWSRRARCSSPRRRRPTRCTTCSGRRSESCAATSTCSDSVASASWPPSRSCRPSCLALARRADRLDERRQRHAPPPARHRRTSVPTMDRHPRRYSHAV